MFIPFVVVVCAIFASGVIAQGPPPQCNVDPASDTESCCLAGLPNAQLCANVTFVPSQQAIKTTVYLGALQLLAYAFDANNTKQCAGNPAQASVCAQVNNFTVTSTGTCGCLYLDVTIAQVFNIATTITCFAFGTITSCPGIACNSFATCNSCNINPQCGFCSSGNGQGQCEVGTQAGPTAPGTCAAPNQWDYHLFQCPP
jgi:hypothetical protein